MLRLISRRLVSLTTSTVANVPCKSEFHSISTTLLRSDRQLTRFVTQNNVCFNCGDPGHMRRECPQPSKDICFNCREIGHISSQCPHPVNQDNKRDQPICFNCGMPGHVAGRCTQPPRKR